MQPVSIHFQTEDGLIPAVAMFIPNQNDYVAIDGGVREVIQVVHTFARNGVLPAQSQIIVQLGEVEADANQI